jgi:hypothetical protein
LLGSHKELDLKGVNMRNTHKTVQAIKDIPVGARVMVTFWQKEATVTRNNGEEITVQVEQGQASYIRNAGPKEYKYTIGYSKDCEQAIELMCPTDKNVFRRIWTACEEHYGITFAGSGDPNPFRAIALAALKGDPAALDMINDGLKDGDVNRILKMRMKEQM